MIRTGCSRAFGPRRGASEAPHRFGFQRFSRKFRTYAPFCKAQVRLRLVGQPASGGPASLKKKGRRSPHAAKKRERRYNPSRQVLRTLHGNCPYASKKRGRRYDFAQSASRALDWNRPYASKKRGRRYNRLRSAFGALHGELPLRPSRSPAQRQGHDLGFRQISRRAKPDAIAPVRSLPQTERFVLTFNTIYLQR